MEKRRITIKDIARECGVGLGTASRAINGKPGVRPDVRRKVLNYIQEIGWRCNSLEQRFRLPIEGKAVVFIAPTATFESRYNGELLRSLMETLPESGYAPVVYYGRCRENLERAVATRPYAVVAIGVSDYQAPLIKTLLANETRVIGLGECENAACPTVFPDVVSGAERIVELLRQAGHGKIGFFGGMGIRKSLDSIDDANIFFVRQLLTGIRRAMPGFSTKRSAVSDCFGDLRHLRKRLKSGTHTAWICSDEKMCRQFLRCARELKLSIPDDVSLVAFTPDLPPYAFEQDLTRLYPDNPTQLSQILELLDAPPAKGPRQVTSDFLLDPGATVRETH